MWDRGAAVRSVRRSRARTMRQQPAAAASVFTVLGLAELAASKGQLRQRSGGWCFPTLDLLGWSGSAPTCTLTAYSCRSRGMQVYVESFRHELPNGLHLEVLHQAPAPQAGGDCSRAPLLFLHGAGHAAWCWQVPHGLSP